MTCLTKMHIGSPVCSVSLRGEKHYKRLISKTCMYLMPSGVAETMNVSLMSRISSPTLKSSGTEPRNPNEGYSWAPSKVLLGLKSPQKRLAWLNRI